MNVVSKSLTGLLRIVSDNGIDSANLMPPAYQTLGKGCRHSAFEFFDTTPLDIRRMIVESTAIGFAVRLGSFWQISTQGK